MSEESLFGDELPEPVPVKRVPKKAATKPPRAPSKKELRERAPEIQHRAPAKSESQEEEDEAANLIRLLAQNDMLADADLDKFSEIVEPVIGKASRERMRDWRHKHG